MHFRQNLLEFHQHFFKKIIKRTINNYKIHTESFKTRIKCVIKKSKSPENPVKMNKILRIPNLFQNRPKC